MFQAAEASCLLELCAAECFPVLEGKNECSGFPFAVGEGMWKNNILQESCLGSGHLPVCLPWLFERGNPCARALRVTSPSLHLVGTSAAVETLLQR